MSLKFEVLVVLLLSVSCLSADVPDLDKAFEEFKAQFTEQWKKSTLKYDGPNIRLKVVISDTTFETSSNVLFNHKHGVTLFVHEFLGTDPNSINSQCTDVDSSNCHVHATENEQLFKMDEAVQQKMKTISQQTRKHRDPVQLYFDRDPELFHHILNFLRGYPFEYDLQLLDVRKLEKLLSDAQYYGLDALQERVRNALHSRFNPFVCASASFHEVFDAGRRLKRVGGGLHQTCSVYGVLHTGQRYVEYMISTHGNRRQMIGVVEATMFKSGLYPGHAKVKGISLYGENGHIYRNGGKEAWSASFYYGDRVGVLVEIAENKKSATIVFYVNGEKVKHALDLTKYMNVQHGILFTVNMYDNGEEVEIVQNAALP